MNRTDAERGNGHAQLRDADIMGEKGVATHDEKMHWAALTEEELAIEKKLKRRIDSIIMPCVIAVYLMNYIDRYVPLVRCDGAGN